jgi:hypothetical protein
MGAILTNPRAALTVFGFPTLANNLNSRLLHRFSGKLKADA